MGDIQMITFKLVSKNGSKLYYKVAGVEMTGIIWIDKETLESGVEEVTGIYQPTEKDVQHVLYIAKKKLLEMNFPESCIYATH